MQRNPIEKDKFVRAWIAVEELPGGMMESATGMRFQNLDEHIDTDITRNPSRGEYQNPTGP